MEQFAAIGIMELDKKYVYQDGLSSLRFYCGSYLYYVVMDIFRFSCNVPYSFKGPIWCACILSVR